MSSDPNRQHSTGTEIAMNAFISAGEASDCSYANAPMTPQMPPTYITPGIPRLRLPDFSVRVSPVLPSRRGILCMTALGIKLTMSNTAYSSFPAFLRKLSL